MLKFIAIYGKDNLSNHFCNNNKASFKLAN